MAQARECDNKMSERQTSGHHLHYVIKRKWGLAGTGVSAQANYSDA
jgi:hypothetical protein